MRVGCMRTRNGIVGEGPRMNQTATHSPLWPFAIWMMAVRPHTLTMSLAPVSVGTALAWADYGKVPWAVVLVAAAASALIQIGTNLYNDAADYLRGAHRSDRVGPLNVIALGLLQPPALVRAAWISFAGAGLCGLY